MYLITNKENDIVFDWGAELDYMENGYPRLVDKNVAFVKEMVNVFENVTLREITQKEIDSFDYCFYGIDWGYYPDPFAYVQIAYNPAKKIL